MRKWEALLALHYPAVFGVQRRDRRRQSRPAAVARLPHGQVPHDRRAIKRARFDDHSHAFGERRRWTDYGDRQQ